MPTHPDPTSLIQPLCIWEYTIVVHGGLRVKTLDITANFGTTIITHHTVNTEILTTVWVVWLNVFSTFLLLVLFWRNINQIENKQIYFITKVIMLYFRNNKCIRVFYLPLKHGQESRCAVIKARARRASALLPASQRLPMYYWTIKHSHAFIISILT